MRILTEVRQLDPGRDSVALLYSGGLDSTAAGLLLRENDIRSIAISIGYPGRPPIESEVARRLAPQVGFDKIVEIQLDHIGDYRLDDRGDLIGHYEGWFPFRNLLFFGLAAHIAERNGCNLIAAGIRTWDGPVFSDATLSYLESLGHLLARSGHPEKGTGVGLFLPFAQNHGAIEELCLREDLWGSILARTWSCWRYDSEPCKECSPCIARARFTNRLIARKEQNMARAQHQYELASDFQPLPGEACFPPAIEQEVVGGMHIAPEVVTRLDNQFIMIVWSNGLPRHETERTVRFPHGLLHFGESLEDCASRLVKDQLGMQVLRTRILHIDSYVDDRNHWHLEPIVQADVEGEPVLHEAAEGVVRFEGDALPDGSVWSSTANFRRKVLENLR